MSKTARAKHISGTFWQAGARLESRGGSMKNKITTQVLQQMETLPESLQRQVLEFIQALQLLTQRGVSGKQLLRFAGTIPSEDLELMRKAIEAECERVDLDEW